MTLFFLTSLLVRSYVTCKTTTISCNVYVIGLQLRDCEFPAVPLVGNDTNVTKHCNLVPAAGQ